MASSYLSALPERFSTPEVSYPRPVKQPGLDSLRDVVRRVYLGPSTLTTVALAKANDATVGSGGGQVLTFRIPQGARVLQDHRGLVLSATVTFSAGAAFSPCVDMISSHIAQVRVRCGGSQVYECSFYNNLCQALTPFYSTDTIRQMAALGGYGMTFGAVTRKFQAPLICPLSMITKLWPACLTTGPLEIEIQLVPGGGVVGRSTGAVTLSYSNYELIYDEVDISQDLFDAMRNQFVASGKLVIPSLGYFVSRGALSVGSTSASIGQQAKRLKSIILWQTLASAAVTSLQASRSLNGSTSWNVLLNGSPVYPVDQTIATASVGTTACVGRTYFDMINTYRDSGDYWRGAGGKATMSAGPTITVRSAASFAGSGLDSTTATNYDAGPIFCVTEEAITGNLLLSNNSVEVRAPVVFTTAAVTAASTLYMAFLCELYFIFMPDGSLSSE